MPKARRLGTPMSVQESIEIRDEAAERASVAAGVVGRIDEDQSVVGVSALVGGVRDRAEVSDVLGDYCAALLLGRGEDGVVGKRAQLRPRRHGDEVVTANA